MNMTPDSFEDIAIELVANDRAAAKFQVRELGARLAGAGMAGAAISTVEAAQLAMKARDALIKELMKTP